MNSPAITELQTESGTFRILNEWLSLWFDGGAHTLGGVADYWPKVNRAFGQGAPAQPLHDFEKGTDAEIRLVMHGRAELASPNDNVLYQGKLTTDFVLLNFWVSAKKPGAGQSDHLAQGIAEKLKALLGNPDARYPLAPLGITHLSPQGPASVMPSADYAKRLVTCSAQLQYAIVYSDAPPVGGSTPGIVPGVVETVNFQREAPLLTGTYLLGYFKWSIRVKIGVVTVTAWPSQGQDTVLELEAGGVLTGRQVVIPQGPANVEAMVTADLGGLYIYGGQAVRWKVVSGPGADTAAWQVNLAMEATGAA